MWTPLQVDGVTPDWEFIAAFAQGVQRHKVRLVLNVVSGDSATGFTKTVVGDLPVTGTPTLTYDGTVFARRTLSVEVPLGQVTEAASNYLQSVSAPAGSPGGGFSRWATLPGDPYTLGGLHSAGAFVDVYWNQQLHSGAWSEHQIAQLDVSNVSMSYSSMTATLQLSDWTKAVEESPIVGTFVPVDSFGNNMWYGQAISAIVQDAFPAGWVQDNYSGAPAKIVGNDIGDMTTRVKDGLAFSGSRADAVSTLLTTSPSWIVENSPSGRFTFRADRLSSATTTAPVWIINDPSLGGFLASYEADYSTDGGYNAVSVSWSSADGETYGQVFLVDNDPASPTYWNGPYGHKVRPDEQADGIATEAAAIAYTQTLLARSKGAARRASMTCAVNPLLHPGDTVKVSIPYKLDPSQVVTELHVVESLDIPLASDLMTLTTQVRSRSLASAPSGAYGEGTYGAGPYGG